MTRRRTPEKFIELAKLRYGDKFLYGSTVYIDKRKDVTITCPKHGDFTINAWLFLRSKYGCSSCNHQTAKDNFIGLSNTAHGNKYLYHKVKYVNATTKVEVVCPKHGSFWPEPYLHYRRRVGCMGCFQENNRLSTETFIDRSKALHRNLYDYSQVRYLTHCDPVGIICRTHGIFTQEPRVHLAGSGCPQCFSAKNRSTTEEFVKQSRKTHGNQYDYSHVEYKTSKQKVEIVCRVHGSFWLRPNSHLSSTAGCPRCKESKGETRIRTFFEKNGISFEQEYKVKPYRYRYDFYIPTYNILLEFHGQQHYKPVELFGGRFGFKNTVRNDKIKKHIAKDLGLNLIVLNFKCLKGARLERSLKAMLRRKGHVFDRSKIIIAGKQVHVER